MEDFFQALIPISICVVLPALIVWLIGRVKQNETNRKAEIMLKALDNGAKIDTDFFKSQSASRTIKERLLGRYILFGVKWNFGKMNAAHNRRAQQAAWNMVW